MTQPMHSTPPAGTEPDLWFLPLDDGMMEPVLTYGSKDYLWTFRPISRAEILPFSRAYRASGSERCIEIDRLSKKIDTPFLQLEVTLRSQSDDTFAAAIEMLGAVADKRTA